MFFYLDIAFDFENPEYNSGANTYKKNYCYWWSGEFFLSNITFNVYDVKDTKDIKFVE